MGLLLFSLQAKDLHTKTLSEDQLLELIETSSEKGQGTETNKSTSAAKTTTSSSAAKTTKSISGTKHKGTRNESVLAAAQTTSTLSSPAPTNGGQSGNYGNQLWVDKYKPTSLKQVIGQQGEKSCANKLLRWLRSWEQNHLLNTGGGKKSSWGWGMYIMCFLVHDCLVHTTLLSGGGDGSQFKAALLSGPPGIGKTTTATLACKVGLVVMALLSVTT